MKDNNYYVSLVWKIRNGKKTDRDRNFTQLVTDTENFRLSHFKFYSLPDRVSKEEAEARLLVILKNAVDLYEKAKGPFIQFLGRLIRFELVAIFREQQRQKAKKERSSISLSEPRGLDGSQTFGETLEDCESENPIERAIANEENELKKVNLDRYFQELTFILTAKEAQILEGVRSGYSYLELAKQLNTNYKYVDNTLERIKAKVRSLSEQGIEPDEIE